MSPSATPATQSESRCHQVPRLPRKMKVDVTKCNACHAKFRGVTGDEARPSAPPEPAQCHKCHACHVKRRWMSPSATPAAQDEGGCRQKPRKVSRRHRRPSPPKRATRASPMSPSATPATQDDGGCCQVQRLPRKAKVDVTRCHACHAR